MNNPKIFCDNCRKYVDYIDNTVPMTGTIKGHKYSYTGKEAICALCGNPVYLPEYNDQNLETLYNEYRKENGIVSLDVIRSIPDKYSIGKRPLSLLLGWGEQTFSRYYDGDIPSRQYSDILTRVAEDPAFYSELLEANKDNLKSESSYEKSRKAVDSIISNGDSSPGKIDTAIQYVLYCCEDITPLSLQKALYYIQGFFYAFYGTFLFAEDCQAWVHGPVYRDIYFKYRDYRYDPIDPPETFDASVISSGEQSIYDSVIKYFCCYSGKVLERFTHNEQPWLMTRGSLAITDPSERIIEKSLIGEYFDTVKAKYNMVNPDDIGDYAKAMFQRI